MANRCVYLTKNALLFLWKKISGFNGLRKSNEVSYLSTVYLKLRKTGCKSSINTVSQPPIFIATYNIPPIYIFIPVYLYTYMHIYLYTYIYTYIHIYTCIPIYTYTYIHIPDLIMSSSKLNFGKYLFIFPMYSIFINYLKTFVCTYVFLQ